VDGAATPWSDSQNLEVTVFATSLDVESDRLADFHKVLSPDERERADRFRFRRDRDRFIAARGLLREKLGRILDRAPQELRFRYNGYGKPSLADEPSLSFNLAHSEAYAVYAFTTGCPIGVDVERIGGMHIEERVAELFFAPAEVAALRRVPPADWQRAFLACWTRKEAFLKARGVGLSTPLQDFEVTFAPDERPAVVRTAWSRREPSHWSVVDLSDFCPGHVAALAARARRVVVHST
jgi:4'-phosphopantetheinyl transferase